VGSISHCRIGLERAVSLAPRIAVARILELGTFRFPGSAEVEAQKDGESLPFLRGRILKTLKGKEGDGEIRAFDPGHWYHHTHAEMIRAGIVSFAELFYQSTLPLEEIRPESDVLFFLQDAPMPPAFPPGAVFLRLGGGFERAGREGEVVQAIREGPIGELVTPTELKPQERMRFSTLHVRHLGGGHKRPAPDGPRCEFVELGLTWGQVSGQIRLKHVLQPDGEQTWDALDWEQFRIQLRGISPDGSCTIEVDQRRG
jgi:hypothetical protein